MMANVGPLFKECPRTIGTGGKVQSTGNKCSGLHKRQQCGMANKWRRRRRADGHQQQESKATEDIDIHSEPTMDPIPHPVCCQCRSESDSRAFGHPKLAKDNLLDLSGIQPIGHRLIRTPIHFWLGVNICNFGPKIEEVLSAFIDVIPLLAE
jgi:hypothetical protein